MDQVSRENQLCYRISKRDNTKGFSLTAAETNVRRNILDRSTRSARNASGRSLGGSGNRSNTTIPSKSARLRSWLLQPSAVPLNLFSTQHLSTNPKELVAINAGGLHYFRLETHLVDLAEAILLAGENVAQDRNITAFFDSYGYKEGCAMCLALGVGCGPAAGNSALSEELRRRAMDAALARAFVPKLTTARSSSSNGTNNGSSVIGSVSTEPLVPSGYEFKPSELSEGLLTIFTRLVRPVWHKPAVVVTEGPSVRQQWSGGTRVAPAKVEVLLNEETAEEITRPLRNLQAIMKTKLARAIKSVPGMSQSASDSRMDTDEPDSMMVDEQSSYLTRAMQYQSQSRSSQSGVEAALTPRGAENLARLIEEKHIHSLYRLLARVIQLLNLMSLLRRAQASSELREVDWGLLHGLTIAQLVQTCEGQDRLESLLNALVSTSASDQSGSTDLSAQTDDLVSKFKISHVRTPPRAINREKPEACSRNFI